MNLRARTSRITALAFGLGAAAILFSACSSTAPNPAPAPSDRMTYRRTDKLDKVWLADGFDFTGYEAALVPPTDAEGIHPKDDLEKERLDAVVSSLARELAAALEGRRIFPAVLTREADLKPGAKTLRLDNTIVEYTRGSSTARYMVGFGAGMPRLRVRGKVTAVGDTKPLCIFEIQRSGDWFGSGFTSSKTLQTQAAIELAEDVAAFVANVAKHEKIHYR